MKYKYTHCFFLISLFIKAINGVVEVVGGVLLLVYHNEIINHWIAVTTQASAQVEHPLHISPQAFASFFLLSHGIIKIFLIVNLLKRKLWAYPSAIAIFGLFTLYQIFRFFVTYSPWMLLLTLFDIIVIILTYLEYKHLKLQTK